VRPVLLSVVMLLTSCKGEPVETGDPAPVDADQDGFDVESDCDDENPGVHPDAMEICNGVDDDCDSTVDDADDAPVWYTDADADGYGDDATAQKSCQPLGDGFVLDGGDCDDADGRYHPGASETDCTDPADYNCDGSTGYTDADSDGFAACLDCDDSSADVSPDGIETCNDVDDDCDGTTDEPDAIDALTWYRDGDDDGWGVDSETAPGCDAPEGFASESGDCDDTNVAYHPTAAETDCADPSDYNCDGSSGYADSDADGFPACLECDDASADVRPDATELCNTIDDDCDGTTDEDDAADAPVWYADTDGDGFGDAASTKNACSQPTGFVSDSTDCDDTDDQVFPASIEYCDGEDDDCDTFVDEEDAVDPATWYADTDGDGYGDTTNPGYACDVPFGYVANDDDCDDADSAEYPSADEVCDGDDDDCDGITDESDAVDAPTWYYDADKDTHGDPTKLLVSCSAPRTYVSVSTDCDDTDSGVYPGASEYCDAEDDDCDGTIDEDEAVDAKTWYEDGDSDGYGDDAVTDVQCYQPTGFVSSSTDCDDAVATAYPGAAETCNGIDDDCDGSTDEGATSSKTFYRDGDGDGYGDAASKTTACAAPSGYVTLSTDCDDTDSGVNPAAAEYCDSEDDDCDGTIDENDATDAATWYADSDADGYGASSSTTNACSKPSGYVSVSTDCDDAASTAYPGATERCNSADDDCDGTVDEGSSDATKWYKDYDGDGYGTGSAYTGCDGPVGYVAVNGDCNDTVSTISPAGTEVCDGVDQDCDGTADDSATDARTWYADTDTDGYGDPLNSKKACSRPSGWVLDSRDCEDTVARANPAGTEMCNSVDDDCDGTTDESSALDAVYFYKDGDSDGYGVSTSKTLACDAPSGYTADSTDCNDAVSVMNPGLTEVCGDGYDNDCDSDDNGCALSGTYSSTLADAKVSGYSSFSYFGYALDGVGDVNGDGYDDIVAAAYSYNPGGSLYSAGRAAVIHGPISSGTASSVADWTVSGTASYQYIGRVVDIVGDLNADGYDDVVIASDYYGYFASSSGAAFVFYGGSSRTGNYGPTSADAIVTGTAASDYVGQGVGPAGDFNDDGYADLIVSAPYYDYTSSYPSAGAAGVFFGPLDTLELMSSADFLVTGSTSYQYVGMASTGDSVDGAGDVNGDGVDDIIVGQYQYGSYAGAVHLFLGPDSGSTTVSSADATLSGSSTSEYLGYALAGLGDVNGDGYDDFGGGGYYGASYKGVAYVFKGGSTVSGGSAGTRAIAKVEGSATYEYMGYAIDGAGDIDGDGNDDVIVGAYGSTEGGASYAGSAVLLYSPPSGTYTASTAGAEFTGSGTYHYFGQQVAGAGDMDGDGNDDLAIGAYYYPESYYGAFYTFFGGGI
jgi:hypothetical protein